MAATSEPLEILEHLFSRFSLIAGQLARRHANRATLRIEDEYDVQDLLHALLRLHFDDMRPEEHTPSYAGSRTSRVDFLLKPEQIVVEVKKTRADLRDRYIGQQLVIDVAHYRLHPDCKTLVALIYAPDRYIDRGMSPVKWCK